MRTYTTRPLLYSESQCVTNEMQVTIAPSVVNAKSQVRSTEKGIYRAA